MRCIIDNYLTEDSRLGSAAGGKSSGSGFAALTPQVRSSVICFQQSVKSDHRGDALSAGLDARLRPQRAVLAHALQILLDCS